jgi:hypothetical protein
VQSTGGSAQNSEKRKSPGTVGIGARFGNLSTFCRSQRLGAPYNPLMQSKSSDEWSRLAKYEYGVWAFLVLAGILALRWLEVTKKAPASAQVLVSLMTHETMELPINIMVVDAVGAACRVIVTPGGAAFR